MGFFAVQQKTQTSLPKGLSLEFLHRHGCQVCPLYKCPGNKNPDMKPTGSPNPLVYILGEAPGKDEDQKARQFIGKAGRILRKYIPDDWNATNVLRWNNCVRTRPPSNRDPTNIEIEACRPSIIADIEKTKPKAIFGFGNIPLYWALGESGITKWAGKRVPIKVGTHTCWFFPMLHPSYVMRQADKYGRSDDEFKFELDLRHAFESIDDLPEPIVHTKDDALRGVVTITGHEPGDFGRVFAILNSEMRDKPLVGYDLETNGLRPYTEDPKLLSAAISNGEQTLAFAINHKDAGWSKEERIGLKKGLKEFLLNAPCRKISFNLPFEMEWSAVILKCKEMLWGSKWGDAMLQAYTLNPTRASDPEREDFRRKGHLSLRAITLEHFGIDIKDIAGVDRKNLSDEPLEKLLPYNGVDAKYHLLDFIEQRKEIKRSKLGKVYTRLLRRIPTAVLTQIKGVPFSAEVVDEFDSLYTKRINRRLAEMRMLPSVKRFKKVAGHEFNPGSNPDCKTLITKILDIPLEKGADEEALEKIKDPFAKALLAWRKATKLRSTYVLTAGAGRIWFDGLLHPILNIMRVLTSRTSSADPNVQNWPKRGPGKVVRRQIKPEPDEVIVAIDYAGIQARNVAMESEDTKLVDVYWNHYDIHTDFTERLIRIYPDWIDEGLKAVAKSTEEGKDLFKVYRNRVKNEFVFPSFFGATPKSTAGYLGIPEWASQDLQEEFWDDFKEVPAWHDKLRKHYARHGWIAGLSGFRHPAPIAHTELVNYPIQADEAVIVCEAMAELSQKGDDLLQANMMVHDDLTFVLPKKKVDTYVPQFLEAMLRINFDWINVPLACEVSIGPDWFNLKPAGEYESLPKGSYKQIK